MKTTPPTTLEQASVVSELVKPLASKTTSLHHRQQRGAALATGTVPCSPESAPTCVKRKEGKMPRVSRRLVLFLFFFKGEHGVFAVLKAKLSRVSRRRSGRLEEGPKPTCQPPTPTSHPTPTPPTPIHASTPRPKAPTPNPNLIYIPAPTNRHPYSHLHLPPLTPTYQPYSQS